MNGKQAKRIRREVYGDDFSPKFRRYTGVNRMRSQYAYGGPGHMVNQYGTIAADPRRQAYQKMKKESQRRQ
jgi:hypothetical protein